MCKLSGVLKVWKFTVWMKRMAKAEAKPIYINEMSYDMTKPTMWLCAPRRLRSAWASTQSDQSLRCLHKKAWVFSYPLSAQRRLWSDWADAQADLSLPWTHTHFVGFVTRWLKWFCSQLQYTYIALEFMNNGCTYKNINYSKHRMDRQVIKSTSRESGKLGIGW